MHIQTKQISASEFKEVVVPGMIPLFQFSSNDPFSIPKKVMKNWLESESAVKKGISTKANRDYHLEEGFFQHLMRVKEAQPYMILGLKELHQSLVLCHDIPEVLPPAKRAFERVLALV